MAKFAETFCSQCGRSFGPGDSGYSYCRNHAAKSDSADEQVKAIIEKLKSGCVMQWTGDGSDNREVDIRDTNAVMSVAAVVLQAIFDHENQPSQFGTALTSAEGNKA